MTAELAGRLFLVGMMGAGKSTVGRLVASRLGCSFVDTDEEIERRAGKAISELFESEGEAVFRELESKALSEASHGVPPSCVSVGGGAVLDPANRALMRSSGMVVWLRATPRTLVRRVGSGEGRPLLTGGLLERVSQLESDRRPLYEEIAQAIVDVDELDAEDVANRVMEIVRSSERPTLDARS